MTIEHEAYFYRILYAVILISPDGGQTMETFVDEDKARQEAEGLVEMAKANNIEGYTVVLSPLDYSPRKNRIMSEDIINEDSEILYGGDSE